VPLVTSANAVDVTVFLTKDNGFSQLLNTFDIRSNMWGNTQCTKENGTFTGARRNRSDQPLGLQWSTQGRKFLGIYLGNTRVAGTKMGRAHNKDTPMFAAVEQDCTSHFLPRMENHLKSNSWVKTDQCYQGFTTARRFLFLYTSYVCEFHLG
jgi:hypothetical protein